MIVPNKNSLKESLLVVLHDLHLRKEAPTQKKYNAAQRIAYTGVIIMGIGSLLTGLSIYKPIQFGTLCSLLGGYEWARAEHFILTLLFTLFFVVHIVQVVLAGWNNFRSMVTGLDVLPDAKSLNLQTAGFESISKTDPDFGQNVAIKESETLRTETGREDKILEKENPGNVAHIQDDNVIKKAEFPNGKNENGKTSE